MTGKHRTETSPPAVAVWLGTGAVALGIGAALTTGAAVASADTGDTGGAKSSSQSGGSSAGPAAKRTAPRSVATARTHQRPSPKTDAIEDEAAAPAAALSALPAARATASASASAGFNPFAALEKAFRKSFLNTAPTIASATGPTRDIDGNYTGQVTATDVDDDPLTYSIGIEPKRGTAGVDAAGNYTYVPDPELAASGGTVTFYIYADEANAGTHLHGFNELAARLLDPLYRLLNSIVPQNPYQFPTYRASNYSRTAHYVKVIVPPA